MTGAAEMTPSSSAERTELLLRISRRSLVVLLAIILLIAATLVAHVVRPGSLLADWGSRMAWLFPAVVFGLILVLNAPLGPPLSHDAALKTAIRDDEFRQANLARAQRTALVAVLIAQIPVAIAASGLPTGAAVTIMGVGTVTVAAATLIASFLYFDRD